MNLTAPWDQALEKLKQLDYIFIDGNHQEKPTLAYFEKCLPFAHNNSLFIFDDIHWSEGMENAWQQIQQHDAVHVTVDLFYLGLVFLKKEQSKEHFRIRL